jgi:hypothetical protein
MAPLDHTKNIPIRILPTLPSLPLPPSPPQPPLIGWGDGCPVCVQVHHPLTICPPGKRREGCQFIYLEQSSSRRKTKGTVAAAE